MSTRRDTAARSRFSIRPEPPIPRSTIRRACSAIFPAIRPCAVGHPKCSGCRSNICAWGSNTLDTANTTAPLTITTAPAATRATTIPCSSTCGPRIEARRTLYRARLHSPPNAGGSMERTHLVTIAICLAGVAACANLPRSRDLANPDVHGKVLAQQVCSNCHGVTGISISPNIPILAGQQEAYLVAQLKDFRKQSRRDPAGFEYMWGISRSLTDNQIDELAKYFSAQRPRVQTNEASPAHIDAG